MVLEKVCLPPCPLPSLLLRLKFKFLSFENVFSQFCKVFLLGIAKPPPGKKISSGSQLFNVTRGVQCLFGRADKGLYWTLRFEPEKRLEKPFLTGTANSDMKAPGSSREGASGGRAGTTMQYSTFCCA